MAGGGDHRCEWRDKAETLEAQLSATTAELTETTARLSGVKTELADARATIAEQTETLSKLTDQFAAVKATVEKLQRHVFGKRSEKMPPVAEAIRDPARAEADRIAALRTRREHAEKKRQLVTRRVEHKVRDDQKTCPKCGGHDFTRLGGGVVTELYELIGRCASRHSAGRTSCLSGTTRPARTWPACTR